MPVTFDGINLLITLPSATPSIDAQLDLYSDWKEWVKLSDNAKYQPAFDTTGGDAISASQEISPYFFLRNDLGWRIKPAEENASINIIGNLYGRSSTLPIFVETTGGFTIVMTIERSSSSISMGASSFANSVWEKPISEVSAGTIGEHLAKNVLSTKKFLALK